MTFKVNKEDINRKSLRIMHKSKNQQGSKLLIMGTQNMFKITKLKTN